MLKNRECNLENLGDTSFYYVFIIYKLKLLDDDINTLYDKYAEAVASSFTGGIKNG